MSFLSIMGDLFEFLKELTPEKPKNLFQKHVIPKQEANPWISRISETQFNTITMKTPNKNTKSE